MSTTPLRDSWNAYKDNLDTLNLFVGTDKLEVDDFVQLTTSVGQHYTGRVVKIGKVNITVAMPYGGYAGADFIDIQEIKFKLSEVVRFYKPKKQSA